MSPITNFSTLFIATLFAAAAALAFHWLLLVATFHLMRPASQIGQVATRQHLPQRMRLARGATKLTRAFVPR